MVTPPNQTLSIWATNNAVLKHLRNFLLGFLCSLLVFFLYVALTLKLDFFDSFQIFENIRFLMGDSGTKYTLHRPIFATLLYLPPFLAQHYFSPSALLVLVHLQSILQFFLWLILVYLLFHEFLDTRYSFIGTFLFAFNPLIIHYAPFAKEDIPAALFTTAAFLLYVKSLKSRALFHSILCGIFISLTMLTRYNLIPLFFLIIPSHRLISRLTKKNTLTESLTTQSKHLIALYIIPLIVFFLIPSVLFPAMGISSFSESIAKFTGNLFTQLQDNRQGYKSPLVHFIFLYRSISSPILLLALFGISYDIWKKRLVLIIPFLWLSLFFLYQLFVIPGKEARYLLPIFPPIYLFACTGLAQMMVIIRRSTLSDVAQKISSFGVLLFLFMLSITHGLGECIHFKDPVYRSPFMKDVSQYSDQLSKGNRLVWVGPFYPIHPQSYVFDRFDDYARLYHFFSHTVGFFTQRPVYTIAFPQFTTLKEPDSLVESVNLARFLKNGDVLILNREPKSYKTSNLPEALQPLEVLKVNLSKLPLSWNDIKSDSPIRAQWENDKVHLDNLPDGHYEIYFSWEPSHLISMGWKSVQNHSLTLENLSRLSGVLDQSKELWLLSFSNRKYFSFAQNMARP